MYALRERRVHVTQEDFEMAAVKVMKKDAEKNTSVAMLWKARLPFPPSPPLPPLPSLVPHDPVPSHARFCLCSSLAVMRGIAHLEAPQPQRVRVSPSSPFLPVPSPAESAVFHGCDTPISEKRAHQGNEKLATPYVSAR